MYFAFLLPTAYWEFLIAVPTYRMAQRRDNWNKITANGAV